MKKWKDGAPENIGLCPLCKKKEMGFLFESAGYHFFRCPACKYVRRREPASETVDIYHDNDYLTQFDNEDEHRRIKGAILRECARFNPPGGRLLDIGCSTGQLLEEARRMGWEPYGLDISAEAVARARQRGFAHVQQATVENAAYSPGFFRVVTMSHVLEHVDDPFAMLGKIAEWIEPGGILCLGEPNFSSFSAWRDGPQWSTLYPSEHISQFTPAAIRRAMEEYAGMDIAGMTGTHRFGREPKGIGENINYFISYLKDRFLIGRSLVVIGRKRG